MAMLQIADAQQLMESVYGNVLQLKVLLVCTMLSLAACNRWWWLPQGLHQPAVARALRNSIAAEIFLGVLILAISSVLSSQVPPRGTAVAPPSRIVLEGSLGERRAVVDIAPARAGGNTVRVSIKDAQGRSADLDEVNRKSTRLNSSHTDISRMPSSA